MTDPFLIQCTTCSTRLRVRDPAAIGHIMPCPKCGGMVLVQRPAMAHAPAATDSSVIAPPVVSPTGSGIRTRKPVMTDAFDDIDSILNGIPVAGAESLKPQPAPQPKSQPPAATSPEPTPAPLPVPEPVASEPESIAEPPVVASEPSSEISNLKFEISNSKSPVAAPTAESHVDPDLPQAPELTAPDLPEAAEFTAPAAAETAVPPAPLTEPLPTFADTPVPPPPLATATSPRLLLLRQIAFTAGAGVLGLVLAGLVFRWMIGGKATPTATAPAPQVAVTEPPQPTPPVDPEAASAPATEPPAIEATDPPATPADQPAPIDPVETPPRPEAKPAATIAEQPPAEKPAEPPAIPANRPTVDPLARIIDQFAPFLDGDAPRPAEKPAAPAAAPASDERLSESPLPRPVPRVVDVDAQLRVNFLQIDYPDTPLVDFVQFLSDATTIPITIDPDALAQWRIAPNTTVHVKLQKATVAEILTESLKPLRLGFVASDGHVLITRAAAQPRQATFDVSDLAADAKQAAELATWLAEFVASDTWTSGGGTGTLKAADRSLVAEQTEDILFRLLTTLDRLRVARRLPPKKSFPAGPETRTAQARDKLATPVSVNFLKATPLVRVLDRLVKPVEMRVLIDWRAVAEVNWSPEAEVTLTVNNQPLGEALTTLLRPMDLAYRVIDKSTLQVSTPRALAQAIEIEHYPVRDLLVADRSDPQLLLQSLRQSLGEQAFRDGGGNGVLSFDVPSKTLFVALPQSQQVFVESQLHEMRKK